MSILRKYNQCVLPHTIVSLFSNSQSTPIRKFPPFRVEIYGVRIDLGGKTDLTKNVMAINLEDQEALLPDSINYRIVISKIENCLFS
jgi:hypothetical protein